MNFDDVSVKLNTQTVKCCATCENWNYLGNLEGECSAIADLLTDPDTLPFMEAFWICSEYSEKSDISYPETTP